MLNVMYNLENLHHQIVINSVPYSDHQQHLVVNKDSKNFPGNMLTLQMICNVCILSYNNSDIHQVKYSVPQGGIFSMLFFSYHDL